MTDRADTRVVPMPWWLTTALIAAIAIPTWLLVQWLVRGAA